MRDLPDAGSRYVAHLLAGHPALAGRAARGRRLRARRRVGRRPDGLPAAGAEVVALHADPDGLNINDGRGLDPPRPAAAAVRAHGADLGIAHDGDADRCLAVDADGRDVDGDQIMAVLAVAMHEAGELVDDTLVATVMSNLGLHLAMREHGIDAADHRGRRPVRPGGAAGRRILPRRRAVRARRAARVRHDGRRAADGAALMARMAQTGKSLADLAGVVTMLPQVLQNVRVVDKDAVAASAGVQEAVAAAEASWARPDGCCSGRRAPSSWSG